MTGTSYFGGKSGSGTYQTIINQIPPHEHYVEGFAGMAGVFRNMKTEASCLLIDQNDELFNIYEQAGFKKTSFSAQYFIFRGTVKRIYLPGDSVKFFEDCRFQLDRPETFIYLDPPYPLSSRKSGPKYKFEMSDEQHIELLNVITLYKKAKVAISTYPNDLYNANNFMTDRGWRMIEFESQTRRGKATEQLWMNYPEPAELHDYQYLGEDYRERERITRMQNRWKAKFKNLPDLEKKAMLQHLQT